MPLEVLDFRSESECLADVASVLGNSAYNDSGG